MTPSLERISSDAIDGQKSVEQANPHSANLPSVDKLQNKDVYARRQALKETLALAFRLFSKYGFDEGVAGHITIRDPVDPNTFWVNPFGNHFSLMKASDLIHVDGNGVVIGGGPNRRLNTSAYMIHHAVHMARPEVVCAAHAHSIYGRTFSAFGRELDMLSQDHCAFWNDHVVYRQFNGVVLDKEEGEAIANCLGNKKVALLQNHGIVATGRTIEEALYWFVSMEKCCQSQLLADAAATGRGHPPVVIGEEECRITWEKVGSENAGWFSGLSLLQPIAKESGGEHKE